MNTNDIWLIAGLGNPEAKYDGTRHNAGFAALDYLSGKWGISVSKTKFQGLWGQGEVDGHKVVLLKPLTYMNLSGDSIAPLAGFFKIPADHVTGPYSRRNRRGPSAWQRGRLRPPRPLPHSSSSPITSSKRALSARSAFERLNWTVERGHPSSSAMRLSVHSAK